MARDRARRGAARDQGIRAHGGHLGAEGVTAVVKEVAEYLGNTPAVCRASYIDPRVVDRFLEGTTIAGAIRGIDVNAPIAAKARGRIERAVLHLLHDGSRAAAA